VGGRSAAASSVRVVSIGGSPQAADGKRKVKREKRKEKSK
jgi:hypothetical protein